MSLWQLESASETFSVSKTESSEKSSLKFVGRCLLRFCFKIFTSEFDKVVLKLCKCRTKSSLNFSLFLSVNCFNEYS